MIAKPKPRNLADVADLTKPQAKVEQKRLALEIERHNAAYYQEDAPKVSDAEYDALRQRLNAIEARFPEFVSSGFAVAEGRRGAIGTVQEGPARGADAVARQCLCRAGRARFRRPHPTLPQARRGRQDRFQRRAEDRRAVDVAALRGRRTRHRRDPRRRRGGRGRHRQYPHARGRAAEAEGPQRARDLRGARRGLYDQAGLSRAQRTAEGGRRHHLRQSAQFGGGLAAPEGSGDHRLAPARLLRLCLGRDERDAGGHPVRHDRLVRALRLQDQSADQDLPLGRAVDRVPPRDRGSSAPSSTTTSTASSTRSIGSTGRSGSASSRARRAGRSRTNSRPSAPRPCCAISRSRSGAPARSRRSASSSRSASAASSCRTSRCTTRTTSRASAATASNCARAAISGSAIPS